MKIRTLVDADLHAFHTDPQTDPAISEGRHEHVWNVQLVFERELLEDERPVGQRPEEIHFLDGRSPRAALLSVIAQYEGRDLPWWSGESIARAFLTIGTADPIGCIVTRPGYRAEVWL